MNKLSVKNDFIFVKRDEVKKEVSGLIIPDSGKEKPHRGLVIGVGDKVEDKTIKKNDIAIFHKTVGFEIDIDDEVYLVLTGREVIATL